MDLPDLTMGRGNLRVILDHEHQQCGLWSLDTISAATFYLLCQPVPFIVVCPPTKLQCTFLAVNSVSPLPFLLSIDGFRFTPNYCITFLAEGLAPCSRLHCIANSQCLVARRY